MGTTSDHRNHEQADDVFGHSRARREKTNAPKTVAERPCVEMHTYITPQAENARGSSEAHCSKNDVLQNSLPFIAHADPFI